MPEVHKVFVIHLFLLKGDVPGLLVSNAGVTPAVSLKHTQFYREIGKTATASRKTAFSGALGTSS